MFQNNNMRTEPIKEGVVKPIKFLAISVFGIGLIFAPSAAKIGLEPKPEAIQTAQKPENTYKLSAEAKLGAVTFSHINHTTKNYTLDSRGPMECIECHHTAQPQEEVAKHPPLKTAWPADRTTTLTAELLEKNPEQAGVAACRNCHSRAGETPKLLPAIPEMKFEVGTAMISLTNQQAYHRNCAGCHDEVARNRTDVNPPTTKKCTACHKRSAA